MPFAKVCAVAGVRQRRRRGHVELLEPLARALPAVSVVAAADQQRLDLVRGQRPAAAAAAAPPPRTMTAAACEVPLPLNRVSPTRAAGYVCRCWSPGRAATRSTRRAPAGRPCGPPCELLVNVARSSSAVRDRAVGRRRADREDERVDRRVGQRGRARCRRCRPRRRPRCRPSRPAPRRTCSGSTLEADMPPVP